MGIRCLAVPRKLVAYLMAVDRKERVGTSLASSSSTLALRIECQQCELFQSARGV